MLEENEAGRYCSQEFVNLASSFLNFSPASTSLCPSDQGDCCVVMFGTYLYQSSILGSQARFTDVQQSQIALYGTILGNACKTSTLSCISSSQKASNGSGFIRINIIAILISILFFLVSF